MTAGTGRRALLLLMLLACSPLPAKDLILDPQESVSPQVRDGEGWVEERTDLPAYPLDANLLEFDVDQANSKFRFFVDSASISTGEKDGVVRYTLVIRSRSGGENVMFEAMHCSARQYKTFAFGTREKKLRPLRKPRWRAITPGDSGAYRRELWQYYLCRGEVGLTRTRDQIVDDFRHPGRWRSDQGFSR